MQQSCKEALTRGSQLGELTAATSEDIRCEPAKLKIERDAKGRRLLNDGRFEMVQKVGNQLVAELDGAAEHGHAMGEPLVIARWSWDREVTCD